MDLLTLSIAIAALWGALAVVLAAAAIVLGAREDRKVELVRALLKRRRRI